MIELRLQCGEAFGVAVDRFLHVAEQAFQTFEARRDRLSASGAIPFALVARMREEFEVGGPSTHGGGF